MQRTPLRRLLRSRLRVVAELHIVRPLVRHLRNRKSVSAHTSRKLSARISRVAAPSHQPCQGSALSRRPSSRVTFRQPSSQVNPTRPRKCRIASGAIASASTCPHIAFQAPPPLQLPLSTARPLPTVPSPCCEASHLSRQVVAHQRPKSATRSVLALEPLRANSTAEPRFTSQGARTPSSHPESRRPNPSLQRTPLRRLLRSRLRVVAELHIVRPLVRDLRDLKSVCAYTSRKLSARNREFSCHRPSPAKARRSPSNARLVSPFGNLLVKSF